MGLKVGHDAEPPRIQLILRSEIFQVDFLSGFSISRDYKQALTGTGGLEIIGSRRGRPSGMTILKFKKTQTGYTVRNVLERGTPVIGRIADGRFVAAHGRKPRKEVLANVTSFMRLG